MMWLNENREEIKAKVGPDGGVTDVAKKAGGFHKMPKIRKSKRMVKIDLK